MSIGFEKLLHCWLALNQGSHTISKLALVTNDDFPFPWHQQFSFLKHPWTLRFVLISPVFSTRVPWPWRIQLSFLRGVPSEKDVERDSLLFLHPDPWLILFGSLAATPLCPHSMLVRHPVSYAKSSSLPYEDSLFQEKIYEVWSSPISYP